jgi:hypothetical protein
MKNDLLNKYIHTYIYEDICSFPPTSLHPLTPAL